MSLITIMTAPPAAHTDWIALAVQVIGPMLTAGVALYAVSTANRSQKRTLELTAKNVALGERQSHIEEIKLSVQRYDKRVAAWENVDSAAWALLMFATDTIATQSENYTSVLSLYDNAVHRLEFQFPDDVQVIANELRKSLTQAVSARETMNQNTNRPLAINALREHYANQVNNHRIAALSQIRDLREAVKRHVNKDLD